ncbi:MAG: 5-formyltetrahydrofolate cyclo-ligase [Isosphaeraceae bacterium]
MSVRTEKRALRRAMVERILAMDPDDRISQERELTARLPELPGFVGSKTVLLYVSAFPEEIGTKGMLEAALKAGHRLALPRVDREAHRLRLYVVNDLEADLEPGTLGILEPRLSLPELEPGQIDWVLAPGLAFDRLGYRLGRGAGHYDRLLVKLRPETPRWALLLEPQWVESLPVEPHDQELDGLVSRRTYLAFNRPRLPLS